MRTLREARVEEKISQETLSTATGIDQHHISSIENGAIIPNGITRRRLEAQLGPIDYLAATMLPIEKPTRKQGRDKIERRFIKLMKSLHGLSAREKFEILFSFYLYIKRYAEAEKELYENEKVRKQLVENALLTSKQ